MALGIEQPPPDTLCNVQPTLRILADTMPCTLLFSSPDINTNKYTNGDRLFSMELMMLSFQTISQASVFVLCQDYHCFVSGKFMRFSLIIYFKFYNIVATQTTLQKDKTKGANVKEKCRKPFRS